VLLGYFWLAGALYDFYAWCFHYNATVYGPGESSTGRQFLDRFSILLEKSYVDDRWFFYLAGLGLLTALLREIRKGARIGFSAALDHARHHQIMIVPVVYLLFCRVNMGDEEDLIPLLPFVAMFSAVLLIYLVETGASALSRLVPVIDRAALVRYSTATVCAIVFLTRVIDAVSVRGPAIELKAQDVDVSEMVSQLGPGEKVFVLGRSEALVLSGLNNMSKHFNLDHHKDDYLDRVEPGGFAGWFERLKAQRPKVVVLGRIQLLSRKEAFLQWIEAEYEPHAGHLFNYYLRKEQ
jgi:hypothetical protein